MARSAAQKELDTYIEQQSTLDTLRFITCGSVDDGKSTLIGRMLYEAQMIFDDQFSSLKKDSKTMGTQGAEIDFALLVDGLSAEREQGITIDVAYRFFHTDKRKFIVADTPGHEQYTRNMATGASTADVAVILIDARLGILPQTCRHSFICSLMGIKHVVIAINKMDLVGYDQKTFDSIVAQYREFAKALNFTSITAIPMSALKGDNIVSASKEMKWHKGPTLLSFLETVEVRQSLSKHALRFPVQWVNRPNLDFRGFAGCVEAGQVKTGQEIRVLPSGETAKVKDILLFKDSLKKAEAGQAVTLTLDREVDISRGDVIVASDAPCEVAAQLRVKLVWMHQNHGFAGRNYLLKIGTNSVNAQITAIHHKYDVHSLEELSATKIQLNDICEVTLNLDRAIPFEAYKDCRAMGAFILVDRQENHTIAAGMIDHAMRRSHNIHYYKHDIDKKARRAMNGHTSKVLWFTGLSGSGKSTIADALEKALHAQGIRTYLLDGDNVRHGLNKDLGFTEEARIENIRRIAEVSKLMVDSGLVVLTAFISPFKAEREMARGLFEKDEFIEIFVDAPLSVVEKRDPKGLYKKARAGQIPNFTGISSPYEAPEKPEHHFDTSKETVDAIVQKLLKEIKFRD